ncbi:uncharacterized protein LOC131842470 [Achroia grisella]|uniref:uncharacterized protein LOC131842470 n=1 Tax=Achroia grisella TaxID=688607 RepID=UPI0027D27FFD|nr:uncharacterized protein LOC131842470 [Achroia grisella]
MIDAYREKHPLLNEDFSDEDRYNPHFPRLYKPMVLKHRSKSKLKGATTIFRRWPSYWSTAFVYWWIGLGMIVITIFIIYNGFVAFALLPSESVSALRPKIMTNNKVIKASLSKDTSYPNVFMHLLINPHDNIDINTFLPYIEIISSKYYEFKYHLIIVFNDTNNNTLSAEENNETALNFLWNESDIKPNIYANNIVIEQTTLSKYMDNSPLRKYWKDIPIQFIEFLIRAISIWDKGGIAFNPTVLTPQTPHYIYGEKVHNILVKYGRKHTKEHVTKININNEKKAHTKKHTKKVNNIQDIIEEIEHNENFPYNRYYSVNEANNNNIIDVSSKQNLSYKAQLDPKNTTNMLNINEIKNILSVNISDKYEPLTMAESKNILTNVEGYQKINNTNITDISSGLLPLFFKFLFNDVTTDNKRKDLNISKLVIPRKRKSIIISENNNASMIKNNTNSTDSVDNYYRPIIIPANDHNIGTVNITKTPKSNAEELTFDLKGNIIATKIPCHAFLGTIFNNVNRRTQDKTVTDFLIQELSLFCKGLLSKCNGIDVILL